MDRHQLNRSTPCMLRSWISYSQGGALVAEDDTASLGTIHTFPAVKHATPPGRPRAYAPIASVAPVVAWNTTRAHMQYVVFCASPCRIFTKDMMRATTVAAVEGRVSTRGG